MPGTSWQFVTVCSYVKGVSREYTDSLKHSVIFSAYNGVCNFAVTFILILKLLVSVCNLRFALYKN